MSLEGKDKKLGLMWLPIRSGEKNVCFRKMTGEIAGVRAIEVRQIGEQDSAAVHQEAI